MSHSVEPVGDFDRGRFQRVRWTVFALLALSYIGVYFHRMAPGAVATDLMETFQTSAAALGSLAATYYYIYTAMQIPAGILADTLGPRISVTVGALVAGLGSILFGQAADFSEATLGRFMVGLGVSVIFVGLMKSNTVWFSDRQYGRISGVTLMIGNIGSIMAAGPLAALLTVYSWRDAFVTAGVISLGLAVATWLWVRNRPEDAGFPSVQAQEGLPEHARDHQHWLVSLKDVLKNRDVWPGFWVNFGITGSLFSFAGLWGVPLMMDVHGLSRPEAALYTTWALAGFALGCLFMGSLSDRLGRRRPLIVLAGLLSATLWVLMAVTPWRPGWSGTLLYALLGLSAGGFVITYACAKEVVLPANAGMGIALVNMGLFLGAAVMQTGFGWAMDLSWDGQMADGVRLYSFDDYRNGLWLSFAGAALALLASLKIRETNCKNIASR